ncbi:MAG: HAMP domain-containing protein [Rhodobacteraceae bacterium]|nr:MAG: HAMP domain-containing protein [Paracoccaceae bacterium]
MTPTAEPDAAPPQRGHGPSIVGRLRWAFMALAGAVALVAALAVWGAGAAQREAAAVEAAFAQLERARAIDAAFNRYLLRETERRLSGEIGPGESHEAAALRGALLAFRRAVEAEMGRANPAAREARRPDLVNAVGLFDLFERVETVSMLDRARGDRAGPEAARQFLALIASDRDRTFRALIAATVERERAAAEAAFARLAALRERLALAGSGIAVVVLGAAALFARALQQSLLRPIVGLSAAAEAFGAGARGARAPADLTGEFATLGAQFDAMAARIDSEQARLEAEVAARTAELEAANGELRRIDAQRRRFFAAVSHELRTPITVLLGEAQVALRGEPTQDDLRAALDRIAASGGYLRRRLDDLLNLARSEDGALTIARAPCDLGEAARAAVEAATAYAAAQEVALDVDVAGPAPLIGDAEALRQAALALIDNAVKLSPPGGRVRVTVAADDRRAILRVVDAGPGFAEGEAAAAFEAYAQGAAGRRAGGAGLGLAVVRWIAAQHQGVASAMNGPEGGAVVTLSLPRAGAAAQEETPA